MLNWLRVQEWSKLEVQNLFSSCMILIFGNCISILFYQSICIKRSRYNFILCTTIPFAMQFDNQNVIEMIKHLLNIILNSIASIIGTFQYSLSKEELRIWFSPKWSTAQRIWYIFISFSQQHEICHTCCNKLEITHLSKYFVTTPRPLDRLPRAELTSQVNYSKWWPKISR